MKLNKRPCRLGLAQVRSEKHGDEDTPALSIPIEGVMLEDDELNAILDEKHAHKVLFNTRTGGKSVEPLFTRLKPFAFKDKVEGSITLKLGANITDVELESVRFAKMELERLPGGLTALSFSVQANEKVEKYVAKLIGKANSEIDCVIEIGDVIEPKGADKQQELAINGFGKDEKANGEEKDGPNKRIRDDRPAAH